MTTSTRKHDLSDNAVLTALAGDIGVDAESANIQEFTGWPIGGDGKTFTIVLEEGTSGEEHVECSGRSGGTLTFSARGTGGTTPAAHAANAPVMHVTSAVELQEVINHASDPSFDDHTQYVHKDLPRTISANHHHSGDNTFSGDNNHTGTEDFNGPVNFDDDVHFTTTPVFANMGGTDELKTLGPGSDADAGTSPRMMRADAQLALDDLAIYRMANQVGKILITAGNVADADFPNEWLRADQGEGVAFNAGTYPKLNAYLGGNILPNYRGMALVGASPTNDVGEAFGQASVDITLETDNMPAHAHDDSHGHTGSSAPHHHDGASGIQYINGSIAHSTIYTNVGSDADHSPAWNLSATASTADATASVAINNHNGNTGSAGSGDPFTVDTVSPSKAVAVWIKAH